MQLKKCDSREREPSVVVSPRALTLCGASVSGWHSILNLRLYLYLSVCACVIPRASRAHQVLRRARYLADALASGSNCSLKRPLGDKGVSHSCPVVEEQTVRQCRKRRLLVPDGYNADDADDRAGSMKLGSFCRRSNRLTCGQGLGTR